MQFFLVVLFWFFVILTVFCSSLYQTQRNKNAFGPTPFLWPLGIFVWGDGVIIAPFWLVAAMTAFVGQSWLLFFLFTALFWAVRSGGEVMYWLLQQFSSIERNPPQKMLGYQFFHNDSIWFVYQVFWQCVLVCTLVSSVLIVKLMVQ